MLLLPCICVWVLMLLGLSVWWALWLLCTASVRALALLRGSDYVLWEGSSRYLALWGMCRAVVGALGLLGWLWEWAMLLFGNECICVQWLLSSHCTHT